MSFKYPPVIIPGGWHCRMRPDGGYASLKPNQHVQTHLGNIAFLDALHQPLYIDVPNEGEFKFAGQCWPDEGADKDHALEWKNGQWKVDPRVCVGVRPLLYGLDGTLHVSNGTINGVKTSQGYMGLGPNGEILLADHHLTPANGHDFHEWTELECGLVIGQRGYAGDEIQVWDGSVYRTVIPGICRFPHRKEGIVDGETVIAISCYRLQGDGQSVRDSYMQRATEAELRALPVWEKPIPQAITPNVPSVAFSGVWWPTADAPGTLVTGSPTLSHPPHPCVIVGEDTIATTPKDRIIGLLCYLAGTDDEARVTMDRCTLLALEHDVPLFVYDDRRDFRYELVRLHLRRLRWVAVPQVTILPGEDPTAFVKAIKVIIKGFAGHHWVPSIRAYTSLNKPTPDPSTWFDAVPEDVIVTVLNELIDQDVLTLPGYLGPLFFAYDRLDGILNRPKLHAAIEEWLKVPTTVTSAAEWVAALKPDWFGAVSQPREDGYTVPDLADFFIGDPALFPRTGTHPIHQHLIDGGDLGLRLFFMKFGPETGLDRYEELRLSPNWLHQIVDASNAIMDSRTDTRWFPRTMQVGYDYLWTAPPHDLVSRNRQCQIVGQGGFAIRNGILAAWEQFDCGRDLGIREVICIISDNTNGWHQHDRGIELGWYAKGVGPLCWEYHRSDRVFETDPPQFNDYTLAYNEDGSRKRSLYPYLGGPSWTPEISPCPLPMTPETPPVTVPDFSADVAALFATDAFNLSTKDGCGIFTDAVARLLKSKDARFGHLKKNPGQNQYDGHAVDAVLYLSDTPGQSVAVDIIFSSETPEAKPSWGLDVPRYSPSDWRDPGPQPMSKVVRPALAFMAGMTGFDWGTHRDQGWLALHTEYKLPVIRIVPQSVFRTPRTLEGGIDQLDAALAMLATQGRKALVVINCDTKEYGMDRNAVKANTSAINAVMVKHLSAVAAATLCNENSNGNEQPFMTDPFFLLELDGLVDARIPLGWGCMFGRDVSPVAAGGSWIAHHSDRGLSPDENGKIMAAAQQKFGKPVVDQEPLGLAEPGTPGQRTYDPNYGKQLGVAAKQYKLGGLIYHTQAGLRASVAEFGPVHRAGAVALVEGLGGFGGTLPGPSVPPVGGSHPILDVDLRKSPDAMSDAGYTLIVSKRQEVEAEAVKWYTKSRGHKPADSDVAVMVYVRGVAERDRWGTFRAAWENGWPGGAAA